VSLVLDSSTLLVAGAVVQTLPLFLAMTFTVFKVLGLRGVL